MTRSGHEAPALEPAQGSDERRRQALELMIAFAERTGLTGGGTPDRYLWTDAFAVCNFLGLGDTGLALRLVEQVHRTLGQYAPGDRRQGWLSGLDPEAAEAHPTVGGLRIGKKLPERGSGDPPDDRLEWDRDGQYFHYLTKWIHALDQVASWTGEPTFDIWARELAATAYRAFTDDPQGGSGRVRRMSWKMSVDLSRPLVPSMGHHDPLDGFVTCLQLQATAAKLGALEEGPPLAEASADLARMIPSDLATSDPLGIGGLLVDAWRLSQVARDGSISAGELPDRVLEAAESGLSAYASGAELDLPAGYRLGFRELGLAIGLAAVDRMAEAGDPSPRLARLEGFARLRGEIEGFWLDPDSQATTTWRDHRNINEVMLATSLAPEGFLTLP